MSRKSTTAESELLQYLARRDHSELELQQKLSRRFDTEEVAAALHQAKIKGHLPNSPQEVQALAVRMAEIWHRKQKGLHWINGHLQQRGLPPISSSEAAELAKARSLVNNWRPRSVGKSEHQEAHMRAKLGRFLHARGFDDLIIGKALAEWKS